MVEPMAADLLFPAVGVKPSPILPVQTCRWDRMAACWSMNISNATEHPNIFGGGDCVYFQPQPLDKVGVYAVRENPVLYHNLMAALAKRSLQRFNPGSSSYLLIYNLGGGNRHILQMASDFQRQPRLPDQGLHRS